MIFDYSIWLQLQWQFEEKKFGKVQSLFFSSHAYSPQGRFMHFYGFIPTSTNGHHFKTLLSPQEQQETALASWNRKKDGLIAQLFCAAVPNSHFLVISTTQEHCDTDRNMSWRYTREAKKWHCIWKTVTTGTLWLKTQSFQNSMRVLEPKRQQTRSEYIKAVNGMRNQEST